ncbi:MAG: hypothetical protein U0939_10195 [Pirellulales bacterium]
MQFSSSMRTGVLAVLTGLLVLTTLRAQDAAPPSPPPAGARMVAVEFQLIDLPSEAVEMNGQASELTAAQIVELVKANKALAVSRLKLNAIEGFASEVQFGERVSTVVGRTLAGPRGGGGGFGETTNIQFENLGFMASVVPKIMADRSIALAITFERSRVAPTRSPAAPPPPPSPATPPAPAPFTPPPKNDQIRVKSSAVVKPNEPTLLASRSSGGDQGVTTVVIVSASAP